jgi:hypothetical protein
VVANLLGVALADRPAFFEVLVRRLHELRARSGRPHWIVIDEAHHLMPPSDQQASPLLPELGGWLLITVHPDHLAPAALAAVDTVIAVGKSVDRILSAVQMPGALPAVDIENLESGEAVVRAAHLGGSVLRFQVVPPAAEQRRHQRKYAHGELGEDKSFYFRGPQGRLNLRAQNLSMFLQLGDGVDDETWLHHLRQHHFSEWFRNAIRDDELADGAERIESQSPPDAAATRAQFRELIEKRYTLPE